MGWCDQQQIDWLHPTVTQLANFCSKLFKDGFNYQYINCHRSAISSFVKLYDGRDLGSDPLISRLLRGIFRARPPAPKYNFTWDVKLVIDYLISLGPTEHLSLRWMTLKTVALLAICCPTRVSELSAIDIRFVALSNSRLLITLPGMTKTRGLGLPVSFEFEAFPENPLLCPVANTQSYMSVTKPLRGNCHRLFRSYIKPHKAVTPTTIARWIITILSASGIDTSHFKAHSTRSAASSKAVAAGLSAKDIMQAAHWSDRTSTFYRFYLRPIDKPNVSRHVLQADAPRYCFKQYTIKSSEGSCYRIKE
jgi:integrase